MSVITLLTDFGTDDEYVGLMKGVILSINPSAVIVDITHQIDRQDIVQAAFTIYSGYQYFPEGTVHLIVVDPGVGTERGLLALKLEKQFFIAPDNGVLTLLLNEKNIYSLNLITNPNYFRASVSRTFHGRDIIAPVGAHIANGLEVNELGPAIDVQNIACLDSLGARCTENGDIEGEVVAIDHFGNLITNIKSEQLSECLHAGPQEEIRIRIRSNVIKGLSETYAGVGPNTPLALIGSRGYLEIAINKGNAAQHLSAEKGESVRVVL
ncbi:MAG: SAM-dependent chlorinase/fluorinase [Desulfobacterales bacterium]